MSRAQLPGGKKLHRVFVPDAEVLVTRRTRAGLIDLFLAGSLFVVVALVARLMGLVLSDATVLLVVGVYWVGRDGLTNCGSPGKWLQGLSIVDGQDRRASLGRRLLRNATLLPLFLAVALRGTGWPLLFSMWLSMLSLVEMGLAATQGPQRIGDWLAGVRLSLDEPRPRQEDCLPAPRASGVRCGLVFLLDFFLLGTLASALAAFGPAALARRTVEFALFGLLWLYRDTILGYGQSPGALLMNTRTIQGDGLPCRVVEGIARNAVVGALLLTAAAGVDDRLVVVLSVIAGVDYLFLLRAGLPRPTERLSGTRAIEVREPLLHLGPRVRRLLARLYRLLPSWRKTLEAQPLSEDELLLVGEEPSQSPACQVCGEPLGTVDCVCCAGCGTPHHRDCWNYVGSCSTFGCGETRHTSTEHPRVGEP